MTRWPARIAPRPALELRPLQIANAISYPTAKQGVLGNLGGDVPPSVTGLAADRLIRFGQDEEYKKKKRFAITIATKSALNERVARDPIFV